MRLPRESASHDVATSSSRGFGDSVRQRQIKAAVVSEPTAKPGEGLEPLVGGSKPVAPDKEKGNIEIRRLSDSTEASNASSPEPADPTLSWWTCANVSACIFGCGKSLYTLLKTLWPVVKNVWPFFAPLMPYIWVPKQPPQVSLPAHHPNPTLLRPLSAPKAFSAPAAMTPHQAQIYYDLLTTKCFDNKYRGIHYVRSQIRQDRAEAAAEGRKWREPRDPDPNGWEIYSYEALAETCKALKHPLREAGEEAGILEFGRNL